MADFIVTLPDGREVPFPEGTPRDVMERALREFAARSPAAAPEAESPPDRLAAAGASGFRRQLVNTLGAVPDAVIGLADTVTRPVMSALGVESNAKPFSVADTVNAGLDKFGAMFGDGDGTFTPRSKGERIAHKAGEWAGDAAAVFAPAGVAARSAAAARAGTGAQAGLSERIAEALAAGPKTQLAAGAVGGAAAEVSDSPWVGMAASLATPLAIGAGRAVVSPFGGQLGPEQARLAAALQGEGVPLTVGQETGSKFLRLMESVTGTLPTSAGIRERMTDAQRRAYNSAAMRSIGSTADNAAPHILEADRARIGGEFNRLSQGRTVPLGPAQDQALNAIDASQAPLRDILDTAAIDRLVTGGRALVQRGSVSGEDAQRIRSELTTAARDARAAGNNRTAQALRSFRDSIDDAIRGTMNGNDQGAWDTARRQWANLKVIEKAMTGPGAETLSGNVTPARLLAAVQAADRPGAAYARSDMSDIARGGKALLTDLTPNSGTDMRGEARRMAQGNFGGWMQAGGAGAGGMAGLAVDPLTGGLIAGTALGLPPAIAAGMEAPGIRNYLANQLMGRVANPRMNEVMAAILAARLQAAPGGEQR